MKRFLAFALLFGAGLALLARLEALRPGGALSEAPGDGRSEFPVREDEFAGTAALELRGPFSLLRYSEVQSGPRPTRLSLEAKDTETRADGEILFKQLTVVWNDAETSTPRVTIRAAIGSMRLTESGQRYPIDFEEDVAEDRLELEDVEIVLHQGGPVTPLTLEVDSLAGDLSDRLFTSDALATATGPGLRARGRGLLLDLVHSVVRFDSDAEVRFEDEEAGSATLTSQGKLHVLRGTDGGAEVVARDGAALHIEGQEQVDIQGRRINIIATATEAEDGSRGTRLSRLSSHEEAVIFLDLGRFEADRADLQISPSGNMRARLTGEPRASLALEEEGREPIDLDVRGEGPLTIAVASQRSFELTGPANVSWASNRLDAQGGLRGFAEKDGLAVTCWGGVKLTQPEAWLETSALDLRLSRRADAEPLVQIATSGDAHLEGVGEGGEGFAMDAEQIVYQREGEHWIVPLALGVDLRLDEDPPMTIVADRVEDLMADAHTFVAEGEVVVVRGEQRAEGARFEGLGPEHFTLEGLDGATLASLTDEGVYVEGRRIEREGERFSAIGSAAAQLARRGRFAELHAHALHGLVSFVDTDDGGEEARYDLRSEGGVTGFFEGGGRTGRAEGGTLHAALSERIDAAGEVVASRALFEFDGGVDGEVRDGSDLTRLVARSARMSQASLDDPWVGNARGDVVLTRESETEPSFSGRGDELTIDGSGDSHLAGLDGRVVRFNGMLPGGRYPFVLEAPAAIVSPSHVEANDARIWVRTLSLVPGPAEDEAVDSEIVASADRLSAVLGELLMTGSVEVSGVDDSGEELLLQSEFLQFEAGERSDSDRPVFRRMHAWGGFDFQYGDVFAAHGDRMEARSSNGRLHITGSPALVEYGDWVQAADSFDYDLFLRIIVEASAGWVRSARSAATSADSLR